MIGIFNDSYPPVTDGVALAVRNYAYWLHRKEQAVCVVTVKMKGQAAVEDYPVYRYASLPLPVRKPFRVGLLFMDVSFLKTVEKIPFKLIHVHCPFSSASVALYLAKQQKIPVVATFHSKYRDDFERHVPNRHLVDWMVKRVVDFYEKADEVWIPQPAVEETLREYGYRGKTVVVNNATDFVVTGNIDELKQTAREELNIPPNIPVFLFTGQHIWEKNVRMIVEALSLMGDVPFRMFFYRDRICRAGIAEISRPVGFRFAGTVSRFYSGARTAETLLCRRRSVPVSFALRQCSLSGVRGGGSAYAVGFAERFHGVGNHRRQLQRFPVCPFFRSFCRTYTRTDKIARKNPAGRSWGFRKHRPLVGECSRGRGDGSLYAHYPELWRPALTENRQTQ